MHGFFPFSPLHSLTCTECAACSCQSLPHLKQLKLKYRGDYHSSSRQLWNKFAFVWIGKNFPCTGHTRYISELSLFLRLLTTKVQAMFCRPGVWAPPKFQTRPGESKTKTNCLRIIDWTSLPKVFQWSDFAAPNVQQTNIQHTNARSNPPCVIKNSHLQWTHSVSSFHDLIISLWV